jgi:hypothetical protein
MSPFKAFHSYDPPLLIDLTIEDTQALVVRHFLEETQQKLKQQKENLKLARDGMKPQQVQHCSEWKFEVTDWVLLRLNFIIISQRQKGGETWN